MVTTPSSVNLQKKAELFLISHCLVILSLSHQSVSATIWALRWRNVTK